MSVSNPTTTMDQSQSCGRSGKLTLKTALNTIDAAKTRTPSARARMTRKSDAAKFFACTPKRRLSNS